MLIDINVTCFKFDMFSLAFAYMSLSFVDMVRRFKGIVHHVD